MGSAVERPAVGLGIHEPLHQKSRHFVEVENLTPIRV
jgi:hypothetical protein